MRCEQVIPLFFSPGGQMFVRPQLQAREVTANVSALLGWSRLILKQTVVESDELGEYSDDAMVRMSLPGVETTC